MPIRKKKKLNNSLAFAINLLKNETVDSNQNNESGIVNDTIITNGCLTNGHGEECEEKDVKHKITPNKILTTQVQKISLVNSETIDVEKYFNQRYEFFRRFDQGIQLDTEGWYSVIHERISVHIASRIQNDILLDGFCGVGGFSIHAANFFLFTLANDIDYNKLVMAKNNAAIYQVSPYIDFVCCDYFNLVKCFRVPFIDVAFLDVPWGGPQYLDKDTIDICSKDFSPINMKKLVELTRTVTPNMVLGLPRNSTLRSIGRVCHPHTFEVEKNYKGNAIKRITVYVGDTLCRNSSDDANEHISKTAQSSHKYHDSSDPTKFDIDYEDPFFKELDLLHS